MRCRLCRPKVTKEGTKVRARKVAVPRELVASDCIASAFGVDLRHMRCLVTNCVFANARAYGGYPFEQRGKQPLWTGNGPRVFLDYATSGLYSVQSHPHLVPIHINLVEKKWMPNAPVVQRAVLSVSRYTELNIEAGRSKLVACGFQPTQACGHVYSVETITFPEPIRLPIGFLGKSRVDRWIPLDALEPFMYLIATQLQQASSAE